MTYTDITAKSKAKIEIAFHFERPENTFFETGDSFAVDLPKGLNFSAGSSGFVEIGGVSVPWTISGGQVIVTLTSDNADALNFKDSIWGRFTINGIFDYIEDAGPGAEDTSFKLGDQTVSIERRSSEEDPKPPTPSELDKTFAGYDPQKNEITWKIEITAPESGYDYSGYTLKDTITGNHTYTGGTFEVNGVSVADTGASLTIAGDSKSLSYVFPAGSTGDQTIIYKTTPVLTPGTGTSVAAANKFSNEAQLWKGAQEASEKDDDSFEMGGFFGKVGSDFIEAGGKRYVQWKVTVTLLKSDPVFTFPNTRIIDTLPTSGTVKHKFINNETVTTPAGTKTLNVEMKAPGGTAAAVNPGTSEGEFQISGSDNEVLTYRFPAGEPTSSTDSTRIWELTYWTEITDWDADGNNNEAINATNSAKLVWDWPGGTGGTGPWTGDGTGTIEAKKEIVAKYGLISKQSNGDETFQYSPDGNYIKWTVVVNSRKLAMSGTISVTDVLENQGDHVLVVDTVHPLEVWKNTDTADKNAFSSRTDDLAKSHGTLSGISDNGFTLTFDSTAFSDTYTITFFTKLTETGYAKLYKNSDHTFKNDATLNGHGPDGITVSAEKIYKNQMLDKILVSYNHDTHIATWKLVVNRNRLPMKSGTALTDTLPAGLSLDPNDATAFSVTAVNGAAPSDTSLAFHGIAFAPGSPAFTLTFPGTDAVPDRNQYEITFTTKVNDDQFLKSEKKTFNNSATLKVSNSYTITDADKLEFTYSVITKKDNYNSSNPNQDTIIWTVDVNPAQIALTSAKIKDLLVEGLELVPGSIELYHATVNPSTGALTQGTPVTLDADAITPITQGNQSGFELALPEGKHAYILVFETTINQNINGLQNTIELWGSDGEKIEQGTSTKINIKEKYSSGGSGSAALTVKKTDESGNPMEDVAFTLWTAKARFKTNATTELPAKTTSPAGEIEFSSLPNWVFYVKEDPATVPAGYLAIDGLIGGVKPGAGSIIEVINKIGYAPVQITKKGTGNVDLSGGTFVLDGTPAVPGSVTLPITKSAENGAVDFGNLPMGTYTIKETSAPTGHIAFTGEIQVVVGYTSSDKTAVQALYSYGTMSNAASYTLINEPDPTGVNQSESLSFTKLSSDGTPLVGAKFELRKQSPNDKVAEATSGADGKVTFNEIPIGDYYIYETITPDGYLNPNATPSTSPIFKVKVSYNSTNTALQVEMHAESGAPTGAFDETARTFKNTPAMGEVKFTKKDSASDTVKINGGTFVIEGISLSGQTVAITSTAVDGIVTFKDVPVGDHYTIRETVPPSGYFLTTKTLTGIQVKYTDNTKTAVADLDLTADPGSAIANDLIPYVPGEGKVTVTKVDEDGKVLSGAIFTLYDSNGKAVASMTTGADGLATFTKLKPYSNYTIKETAAPAGYELSGEVLTATTKDSSVLTFTMVNKKTEVKLGSASIFKTDADAKKLPGATFTLYDGDNKAIATAVTGQDGVAVFKDLTPGMTYTVKETLSPIGYQLSGESLTLNVTAGAALSFTVVNRRLDEAGKGDVRILKTDANGAALGGATFTLYDAEGRAVASATSGADGGVTFTGIPANVSYTIKETAAPNGYTLSGDVLSISLEAGQVATYTVVNHKLDEPGTTPILGSLSVMKVDSANARLAGAEFTLYDASGTVYASTVTGADGIARFTNLPLGSYSVAETRAPQGYSRFSGSQAVELTADKASQSFTLRNVKDGESPDVAGWEEIGEPPVPGGPGTPGGTLPKTGEIPMSFYLLLAGLSLLGAGFATAWPRKKNGKRLLLRAKK
ncbi:MAG TPA: SpaA isopeptide-forming pilin-related protein [Pseudoflavonifractor sp.]|nr:SpaA isopeptide-forming pilin-related protein [Pseudoflavonifractor sp.]